MDKQTEVAEQIRCSAMVISKLMDVINELDEAFYTRSNEIMCADDLLRWLYDENETGQPIEEVIQEIDYFCSKSSGLPLKEFYFTFGQNHEHLIDEPGIGFVRYDKDVVAVIKAVDADVARGIMFGKFGRKWSMQYNYLPSMDYFPRGVLMIN